MSGEPVFHLVHVRTHPRDRPSRRWHYIGRDMTKVSPLYKASALGKPASFSTGVPGGSWPRYRCWLALQLVREARPQWKEIREVLEAALEPGGVCLACWCKDLTRCHGNVVAEVARAVWDAGLYAREPA